MLASKPSPPQYARFLAALRVPFPHVKAVIEAFELEPFTALQAAG